MSAAAAAACCRQCPCFQHRSTTPQQQRRRVAALVLCQAAPSPAESRRELLRQVALGAAVFTAGSGAASLPAQALPGFQKDLTNKRKLKIPESDYSDGPDGLK